MNPLRVFHVVSVDKENYYLNNLTDYSDPESVAYSFVTLAPYCDFAKSLEERGKKVYCLDALDRKNYPRAILQLWKILKNENPDIVHTHLFDSSLIGLTVAKWQKHKTVLTRHHSDAIHEIASPVKRRIYLSLENYTSRKSDHIIAPSQMVRDFLVEKEGVRDEKVTIIPYGQTAERFDAVTADDIDAVRVTLGMKKNLALVCVSRLFHRKGHQYLFQALAALTKNGLDATIYLVGDGDYKNTLKSLAQRLGIADRVKFLGWRNDALAIMAAADIIVHPSLEDALSSAVIEAIMLERPIVATDISGVRDSLDDGKYGEIVAPADSEAFRKGLEKTITNLDESHQRAQRGRAYLLQYMDAKRVAGAYTKIYQDLVY